MKTTIIAVGNGGYNLATDIITTQVLTDIKFIVCDTDKKSLEDNKINADAYFLLDKFRGKVKASLIDIVDDIIRASSERISFAQHSGVILDQSMLHLLPSMLS